ncbi:TerB N-terminal domain-containing protein [Catellatospora bangladeshensis]|uniref:TerB N-terminal domain-containing protein n=1 Tax=Catellatospora bangladeshensis TaxID=310355 RepID=UPI0036179AE4
MGHAENIRNAAYCLIHAEHSQIAQIRNLSELARRHLVEEQLHESDVTRLRASVRGGGLRLGPLQAAGFRTVGQLVQQRHQLAHYPGVGPATVAQVSTAIDALARTIATSVTIRPDANRPRPYDAQLLLALARLSLVRREIHATVPAARELHDAIAGHLIGARRAASRWRSLWRSPRGRAADRDALSAVADVMRSPRLDTAKMAVSGAFRKLSDEPVVDQLWADYRRRSSELLSLLAAATGSAAPVASAQPSLSGSASEPPASAAAQPSAARATTVVAGLLPVGPHAHWVPHDQPVQLGPLLIDGGLFYLGQGLESVHGMVEPALIDPSLRIDLKNPDHEGRGLDYWPAYEDLSPRARAAYLSWLADGRRSPQAPIGYVFLYFYGLERRVLVDLSHDANAFQDLPAIEAEVTRLLSVYGRSDSFRSYASGFLDLIRAMRLGSTPGSLPKRPPALSDDHWSVPLMLRLGLGSFAASGTPVPTDWARAWAWYHPSIYPRTPQTRCAEEFEKLFELRYTQRFNEGIRLRPGKSRVRLSYHPASAGIDSQDIPLRDFPDVFEQAAPTRMLTDLVDSVTGELDAYSRWLGRNPQGRGSLAAMALLPAELADNRSSTVAALQQWAETHLGGRRVAVVNGAELIAFWPGTDQARLPKADFVALAQLLSRLGFGIEPDIRFGGPALAQTAVLFRDEGETSRTAGPAYTAAATLLLLAVAVSAADGEVSVEEQEHLLSHLKHALELNRSEQVRLEAHLHWLIVSGVKLAGVKKRVEALAPDRLVEIGDFLVTVAAADGVISPEEVATLSKIYGLLGLDPATVFGKLHHAASRPPSANRPTPAIGPVVVRPASQAPIEYAIPVIPPSSSNQLATATRRPASASVPPPSDAFTLDSEAIAVKLHETATVSALLSSIFTDDDVMVNTSPTTWVTSADPNASSEQADRIAGLDSGHGALLRDLASKPSWTRAGFEDLAARHGLMPDGAIDVLNEAAYEKAGEPVIEDDGDLQINQYAFGEMSR